VDDKRGKAHHVPLILMVCQAIVLAPKYRLSFPIALVMALAQRNVTYRTYLIVLSSNHLSHDGYAGTGQVDNLTQ